MLLPDYHIHTKRCGHATGDMKEYVEKAIELGLKEIGFADHIPMYWLDEQERDPEIAMTFEEIPDYVSEVQKLRTVYPNISIKLGIEADYIPGYEKKLKQILDAYPFDYVLGSIHFIDGWGFDNPAYIDKYKECNIDKLYQRYFQLLQQAARSGLFTVMAHPDLIKKFGYRPEGSLEELYEETARAFAEAGVYAEINTAGLRAKVEEIYPAPGFLQACRKRAVPVITGSDAHTPEQVGYEFDKVPDLLACVSYTKVLEKD